MSELRVPAASVHSQCLELELDTLVHKYQYQYQYRPYGDEVYSGPFSPEVKHRVMKAPEHEHTEAMFREWAVHGKPKK